MNPTAIYSKSGKGVQEASGKTSFLDRGDRAVLSAIDGRATLADVAKKVGKTFDSGFQTLIGKLDKDGFIREASPGAAPAAKPGAPAGKPAAKADSGGGGDLDFSMLGTAKTAAPAAPSRPAAPPPRPAAPPPPPPPPPPKPNPGAEAQAKAQQSALQKAREEAEAKADAERQRIKLEAEAKMRTEMEAKARDEASQKIKLEAERKAKEEADAKINAAREAAARAAAEAKAKAEAEAKARVEAERKAREEAERARKAAEEEARRVREEAERARKAAEEEARKAREEAERARKEAERARKEAEEAARKAREEAERKAKEEAEAMRRQHEEERKREEAERKREEAERRKAREEEDRRAEEERAAKRRQREEEDAAERREEEERSARRKREEEQQAEPAPKAKKKEEAPAKSEAAGGLDSLMADLDSFTTREEEDRKAKEEEERKAKEAAAQRAREEEERRAREEAERKQKEEARARKDEEKRRKREDEEALQQKREKEETRLRQEEEKRKKEADERARKAKQEEVLAAQANRGPAVAVGEDTDEVRKRMMGRRGGGPAAVVEQPSLRRKKSGWGKPVAITLVILLAAAVGAIHVMPVSTADYERAASEAFGKPVKVGEAHLSLLGGSLQIKLKDIRLGDDVRIASGTASPEFEALRSERKIFSRIELDEMKLPQEAIGQALLAKVKADNFAVGRIVVRKLELTGSAVLPHPLEADLVYGDDGALRSATVRGPDTFLARITPGANSIEYVVTASGLPLPVLPEVTLSDFGMKGTANERGMSIAEWGGKIYGGSVSGTANVRWSGGWSIEGVVTARNINAAVFAPALLSEGRGEGTGRFSMSGAEASKLGSGGRFEGNFTVTSGVLGSFDLGRVIRTSGREYAGRTQFNELSGQATYDRGAVTLRNVSIGAGALNAGASADIAQGGALTGRIIADVKSTSGGRSATATLHLGGTIKEPQVRN